MLGAANATLKIIIEAEDRARKEIAKAEEGLGGMANKLEKMKPAFKKMAIAGVAGMAAVGAGIKSTTDAATKANEIFNKFEVVFGSVGDEAEKVAKDLKENWGLAESSAKDLLSATGDMLTGFGMSGKAALDLAEKTNKLAIDLASFTNIEGGAERASKALTKALLGERESVKELGIAILEEDVKAKVKSMEATGELTNETDRQKRAIATLQIAYEQSKNAIGDFERTQGSLANQQRILSERTKEAKEALGRAFLPIVLKITEKVVPLVEKITKWVEENEELVVGLVALAGALSTALALIGGVGLVLPGIIRGFKTLKGKVLLLKGALMSLQSVGILALLTGTGLLLRATWKEFKKFADTVGGTSYGIKLILLELKIKFLELGEATLNALSKIPLYGKTVEYSLANIRENLRTTKEHFNLLAVEGIRKAESSGEDLTKQMEVLEKQVVGGMEEMEIATDDFANKTDEAFRKAVEGVKSIRDEIKSVREELDNANKDYLKDQKDEEASYHQEVIRMVAGAEEEIKELDKEKRKAIAEGDSERVNELEREIEKQEDIISSYHQLDLDLSRGIAEEKKRLEMNEMERLAFDYQKKELLMKKEYLEGQVLRLQKLVELETEHQKALDYIGREKEAAINADIEKEKSFREMLAEKTAALGSWFSDSLRGYEGFVSGVNQKLGEIGSATPEHPAKSLMRTYLGLPSFFPVPGFQEGGIVPGFQEGGIVPGRLGEPIPAIVHGGETIIPSGRGLGNINIYVQGGNYLDREAGEKFAQMLGKMLRRELRLA